MNHIPIPYEAQDDPVMCGAAALSMIYRSFGSAIPQKAIWRLVAAKNQFGRFQAHTHRMAMDAIVRGFDAVTVKAKSPLHTLNAALSSEVRVIMNHRPQAASNIGHYTVAVGAEDGKIIYHDPKFGESLTIAWPDLQVLWTPIAGPCEIVGNVLVAIAPRVDSASPCGSCASPIPEEISCPGCLCAVPLRPVEVIGCIHAMCPDRLCKSVYCPYCDWELLR